MSTNADDRDWDAEFARITRHLEVDAPDADAARPGAHRDLFDHTTLDEAPTARATPPSPSPSHGHDAGSVREDGPVPGFRAQWRAPDESPATHGHDVRDAALAHFGPPGGGAVGDEPRGADDDVDDLADTDDGTFVPPEPAPFDTGDPASVIMVACFVLGPLWLLYLALFDRDAAKLWWIAATATLVGGFALAVARQPKNREEIDDSDDGARL